MQSIVDVVEKGNLQDEVQFVLCQKGRWLMVNYSLILSIHMQVSNWVKPNIARRARNEEGGNVMCGTIHIHKEKVFPDLCPWLDNIETASWAPLFHQHPGMLSGILYLSSGDVRDKFLKFCFAVLVTYK